jgi:hypothetical protein
MIWTTSGGYNVTTFGHLDGQGTCTVIMTITGRKLWILYKRRRNNKGGVGDVTSMWAFDEGQVDEALSEHFDHEAVVLTAGSIL